MTPTGVVKQKTIKAVIGNACRIKYGNIYPSNFREAFIEKKSITFFTLGSDPPPIFRKV